MSAEDEEPPLFPLAQLGTTLLGSIGPGDAERSKELSNNWAANRHYAAIGRVAAAWAYFEAVVDTWLISFAQLDWGVGVCFTGQLLGPGKRFDAFCALVKHLGANEKKWAKALEKFANDMHGLAEQRNRAVHDVWDLAEATTPLRLEATARRTLRRAAIHVPTDNLSRLEENIVRLTERFEDALAGPLFNELLTSPDTAPPESAL